MATTIGGISLDGSFTDWSATNLVQTTGNTVPGYQVFGTLVNDATLGKNYVIGIDATAATDPAIAANTVIYLNTDQNAGTGFSPFGLVGAEFEVHFSADATGALQPLLYSVNSTGTTTLLNGGAPLNFALSSDGTSLEIAVPQTLLTPAGGTAPTSINFDVLVNNGAVALPGDFTVNPQYTITDTSTLVSVDHSIKKIAIVWSDTTMANFFQENGATPTDAQKTAYADLFMAVQHQAEAAGVSFDVLTEADLTNVAKMAQYSALVFPSMQNVQASQAAAIEQALHSVVYDYHVPIITAGNFMTTDEKGVSLGYGAMQDLLNLTHNPAADASATTQYYVTADPAALNNSIVSGYSAGQHIGGASGLFATDTPGYYNTGYDTFVGFSSPSAATTVADINVTSTGAVLPGVIETTTGATNVHFATAGIMADSNILQHAIQSAVFGTAPALALDQTRSAGIVAARIDMDQSQFPTDITPDTGGPGIYDQFIPILQQWKTQFNFVGSFFVNVGNGATVNGDVTSSNLSLIKPYLDSILGMGSEIGSHSLTHLINPPAGVPLLDANGNVILANVNQENTNTLTTSGGLGGNPNWTFAYEFGQSKTDIASQLGISVAGAAVPGMPETYITSQNILQYYQSTANLTGYVTGGWTGVGSGFPNAFGYMLPSNLPGANGTGGSIYLAPNMTFDFTEVEFQKKPLGQALQDWITQFQELSTNSNTPTLIWPFHDYGATAFSFDGTTPSPYTTAMFTAFIAYASGYDVTFDSLGNPVIGAQTRPGYEFVTQEDLASRIAAQQRVVIHETNPTANSISISVTPGVATDDLGQMALNLTNGAAGQVIQNAGSWYAYDENSIFVARNGVPNLTVTLGTQQDDVSHINSLPMRADLVSVSGDGASLAFTITGDGRVGVDLKSPGTQIVSIQGGQTATLTGTAMDQLALIFSDGALAISSAQPTGVAATHAVTITESSAAVFTSGADIIFGGSGNDTFGGGGGNDYLNGEAGTNTVVYTGLVTDYTVTLNTDGSVTFADKRTGANDGTDTDFNFQNYQFGDGLVLTKDQLAYAVITGTPGNDSLLTTGSLLVPTNQLILALAGNDTLTAGIGNTVLDGGDGNDLLRDQPLAAAGIVDVMSGGAGDDTYVVTRASDVIIEQPGFGTDTVQTALAAYTLADNVENITLTGNASQTITGNSSDNVISGFHGTSIIDGGAGNDTAMFAGALSNYKVTINADGSLTLAGTGAGAANGTTTFKNVESFHFSDGLTVTAAQLGGSTTTGPTIVNGTAGNDSMTSATFPGLAVAGAIILGLGGNDTITAGNIGQSLDGGRGADLLSDNGFAGVTMVGSGGNDTFVVANASTVITELAGAGTDTIQTSLNSYTLPGNVSNLTFIGSGGFTGTGDAAVNTITGGAGNDILDGTKNTTGGDRLVGGAGDDTYIVNNTTDNVVEAANGGTDTVLAKVSAYSLTANVENLTYVGTGNFNGTGNGLNNILTGGAGANTLSGNNGNDTLIGGNGADSLSGGTGSDALTGGAGNDTMSGGGSSDSFYFAPVSGYAGFGLDRITDFAAGTGTNHDNLYLAKSLFVEGATMTDAQLHSALFSTTAATKLHSAADPNHAAVNVTGTNTVVITIDTNSVITLTNVSLNTLKNAALADIHFV